MVFVQEILYGARESLHLAAKVRLKKQRRKLAKKVVKAGCLEDISARSFVRGDGHDAFLSVMTRYWDLQRVPHHELWTLSYTSV